MALDGDWGRMGLRPLEALLPHEETIATQVAKVAAAIERDGMQRDPLVIDSDSGVVLDGMHRLAALKRLGVGYAACGAVDYSSSGITLRRWARVYSTAAGTKQVEVLRGVGLSRECSISEAVDWLESRRQVIAAMTQRGCYVPAGRIELSSGFDIVRSLDRIAAKVGWRRGFAPEDEIDAPLQDRDAIVVLLERLGKNDVIYAGKSGRPFPCKTSMHIIDPRPVGVDVPLEELRSGSSRTLDLRRRSKHTLLPPDSSYGGRRYKERLVLMKDVD